MKPAQSSTNDPILYVRPAAQEKSRFREVWLLVAPALVIVIALCHLVACWNSPQPRPWDSSPHRTIHLVRAGRQTPTPTSASWIEPSLVGHDEPEFATLPAPGSSWPHGGGWR